MTRVAIETITPERARQMWANRAPNRPFNSGVAKRYSRQMKNGEWELGPDAMSFNSEGQQDNGQHRIWAVIDSGTTQRFIVLYHESDTVFASMDQGKKRTLAQILSIDGVSGASAVASATSRIYTYYSTLHFKTQGYRNVTEQAARRWVLNHQADLERAAVLAGRVYRSTKMPHSVGTATAYLFGLVDEADRDAFFTQLDTAAPDFPNPRDPVQNLRRRIIDNSHARPSMKVDEVHVAAWTVKAFNFFREGSQVDVLRWAPGGARPETFPVIKNLDHTSIWS